MPVWLDGHHNFIIRWWYSKIWYESELRIALISDTIDEDVNVYHENYYRIFSAVIAEDIPVDIATRIHKINGVAASYSREAILKQQDIVLKMLMQSTGVTEDQAMAEIDAYLQSKGYDPWFQFKPKDVPVQGMSSFGAQNKEQQERQAEYGADEWEKTWGEIWEKGESLADNVFPVDKFGRDVAKLFKDAKYAVLEFGDENGWYCIATPVTRGRKGEQIGGLGFYIIRKHANKDIPSVGISAGDSAFRWFPKLIKWVENSEPGTEFSFGQLKVDVRKALYKFGLGIFSRRDAGDEGLFASFDPSSADSFDNLRDKYFSKVGRLQERRIPANIRVLIEALAILDMRLI